MWKIVLLIVGISLTSCKTPKPKPADKVKDQAINVNFTIESTIPLSSSGFDPFRIDLDLKDGEGKTIEIGPSDEMRFFLNSVEYQVIKGYCSDLYGPRYLCGYMFAPWNSQSVTTLAQPLDISLEIKIGKTRLITAKAILPQFITLSSSAPADKKFNPLTDPIQINWISSVPLKHILYNAGRFENTACRGSKSVIPQKDDTYIQYGANDLGLDPAICNPMSYAVVTAVIDSITVMQTNVPLASATVRLNQTTNLDLLSEPFSP